MDVGFNLGSLRYRHAGIPLFDRFLTLRRHTQALCQRLETEDYVVQVESFVSPPKWHLAHTTWFFETFLLRKYLEDYRVFDSRYDFLFNSHYRGVGTFFPQECRGWVSRPTVRDIGRYRDYVDEHMSHLFRTNLSDETRLEVLKLTRLGMNHEQQHQELLLMDLKYSFGCNPIKPSYFDPVIARPVYLTEVESQVEQEWLSYEGQTARVGVADSTDFSFDNECPDHRVAIAPFQLSNRLVTNGEFLDFVEDGGYDNPRWWLSDGWNWLQKKQVKHPLYWRHQDESWKIFTLWGDLDLRHGVPVCHVSFYEAEAFARWSGARLPTEFEWEYAACQERDSQECDNFMEMDLFHPVTAKADKGIRRLHQIHGDVWEWTSSSYAPYPGFQPASGAVGEYNGKFMCNQMVARGGSCVTPRDHHRVTYRNFFYPYDRWAFLGLRLARDLV